MPIRSHESTEKWQSINGQMLTLVLIKEMIDMIDLKPNLLVDQCKDLGKIPSATTINDTL